MCNNYIMDVHLCLFMNSIVVMINIFGLGKQYTSYKYIVSKTKIKE